MNSLAAAPEYAQPVVATDPKDFALKPRGVNLNGHVVIFSLTTLLALATASECQSIANWPSLRYGLVLWLWWGVVASSMWKLGQRAPSIVSFSPKTISVHIFIGSVLGLVHLLILGSLGFTVTGWQAHATALSIWVSMLEINRFGIEVLIYGFVFGITGIVQFQIRAQREALRSLALQRQLSTAHLQALQMQLEPHFLFNTLNAITSLVDLGRQKQAAEMLSHLNAMLRRTLMRTTPEKVPLAQELEIIENYLAIEQIRFADRLRIEIKVDPGALDGLIPSFLLQPIVENAIRHGIAACENEGLVEASARRDGKSLHLRIRDTGPGVSKHQHGHGIGLKNTRERLMHFYPGGYAMSAQPIAAGGFEVAITIPYERN
jgi:sensor histidine kinase YesM